MKRTFVKVGCETNGMKEIAKLNLISSVKRKQRND